MNCPNCNMEVESNVRFCRYCGKRIEAPTNITISQPHQFKKNRGLIIVVVVLIVGVVLLNSFINCAKDISVLKDNLTSAACWCGDYYGDSISIVFYDSRIYIHDYDMVIDYKYIDGNTIRVDGRNYDVECRIDVLGDCDKLTFTDGNSESVFYIRYATYWN